MHFSTFQVSACMDPKFFQSVCCFSFIYYFIQLYSISLALLCVVSLFLHLNLMNTGILDKLASELKH